MSYDQRLSLAHPNRRNAAPLYYAVHDLKKVICSQQRAGTASFAETLRPAHSDSKVERIQPTRVFSLRKSGWPVVMWIRDPLEKFASAFAIFGRERKRFPGGQKWLADFTHPTKFFNAARNHPDAHWMPQTKCHRFGNIFLPTRILLFEEISRTWPQELSNGKYPLRHENKTADRHERKTWAELRDMMPAKTVAEILKYYEEDIVMHEWCKRYGLMENAA